MPSLGSGGAERVIFNVLNGLAPLGLHTRILLLFSRGFLAEKLPSNVIVEVAKHNKLSQTFFTIWKALKSDTDIIFCSGYHNPFIALLAYVNGTSHKLILRETSVVSAAKGRWKAMPILRSIILVIYNSCACVIFQSSYNKEDFERFFGFRLNRWEILINPSYGEREINSNSGKNIFLVGTLNSNKNFKDALLAINDSGLSNITVEIFGSGPEGKKLELFASNSNFNFKVLFHGNVTNMDEHWNRASLHVVTSKFESFPNVVIEAAMAGVPTVCLSVPGGIAELFKLGDWGKLVSRKEDLAGAIRDTYSLLLSKRLQIAENAKEVFQNQAMIEYRRFMLSIDA